ncbi:MAG: thiolase domain-containing protein [archaeon GB-1867-005]|nr:thiolase domain-containing protein [Candidatus Culexmicrobium cathedralense]
MREPLAAIVSAGLSKFGKIDGKYARELFAQAFQEALDRCPNLDPKEIKVAYIGQMSGSFEHQEHNAPIMLEWINLLLAEGIRVENACASSGTALRLGVMAIASGFYDVVLIGGVEKMTHRSTPEVTDILAMAADFPFEQWHGLTFPGLFALMAVAHMHKYGTTEEQMALVAVKNHRNALLNPKAHMHKEVTVEKVLSSRIIAWPLKLYDCSLISDGASCLILTKPEIARKYTDTPVYIIGSGQGHDTIGLYEREDLTTMKSTRIAAERAYKMAKVEPKDVDVAEVHDCFTIAEIIEYEDLGFCRPGEGGRLIEEGVTFLDGDVPVNTSGGLKAKGHPVGATGAAQAYEIYLQLTGEAGRRQVKNAEIGLTHNLGGSGATSVVHIYVRGD